MPSKSPRPKPKSARAPRNKPATPARKLAGAQREYAGLRLFLSRDEGFQLALACFDRPATREGLMARLGEELARSHVLLSTLDVLGGDGSLMSRIEAHLAREPTPAGWRRAVAVINLEARLQYSELPLATGAPGGSNLTFLEEANLHRDAYPRACPCPVVLWLTELAEAALAKHAPDLWHWRNARFDFEREDSFLHDFRTHPAERISWFEKISAAAHRLGDKTGEVWDLISLGNANYETGKVRAAVDCYQKALNLTREVGDRRSEGAALGNLGIAYADLGETSKAIEFHEQHLSIAREIGNRRSEGSALGNLGLAYAALGETRKAIEFYEQALVVDREIGDRRGEGSDLGNLGNAYADLGETREAIEFYEQHLSIAREIGDRRGEGAALGNLGLAYAALGETRKAIEFHEQQLSIAREIGDRRGEGAALINSANACEALGSREKAVLRAEAALKIYESIESPHAANVRSQLAAWRGREK